MHVAQGTIVVWSDLACPWATVAVHHLITARRRLGLDGQVVLDHRAFPLELVNGRSTPRLILEAEVPVVGALAPDFGWRVWRRDLAAYPGTVLLGLEAVQAAKEQSLAASEELDYALRHAFYVDSQHIGMRHTVVAAAERCAGVDAGGLADALDDGRARRAVIDDWRAVEDGGVQGSPHLFLPDGTDAHNPGVRHHWAGGKPGGFPVVDEFDASVYDDLVRRAAD